MKISSPVNITDTKKKARKMHVLIPFTDTSKFLSMIELESPQNNEYS